MLKDDSHLTYSESSKAHTFPYLLFISFMIVAFGQPVWSSILSVLSSFLGFALFWKYLLTIREAKKRFWIGTAWFGAVQLIQFWWVISHPYAYIYAVLALVALLIGFQWGIICLFIKKNTFYKMTHLILLPCLWTLFELSRLYVLSGLPFNPSGLALSSQLYSLQFASLMGILGLSFWVMLTNAMMLRAWIFPFSQMKWAGALLVFLFPYFYGWEQINFHQENLEKSSKLAILLVQPALPIDECVHFQSHEDAREFVLNKWERILLTIKDQVNHPLDFLVFPEYVVPYGTFAFVYPVEEIHQLFEKIFGKMTFIYPPESSSYQADVQTPKGMQVYVSNAYIVQTLANLFKADVIIGLEDNVYAENETGHRKKALSYTSAFHFKPNSQVDDLPQRYEKRVLVPMGEYIPFAWCRELAANYGITGSFTPGESAKIFYAKVPFSCSICYEELFSELMLESRSQGAELLVNLTNDGWFPSSLLPKQHFDHARLRTVENGVPLVRACNTGITGAIDSLGQIVGTLGNEEDYWENQNKPGSILVAVPSYHYLTLFALTGNLPLILFCLGVMMLNVCLSLTDQIQIKRFFKR